MRDNVETMYGAKGDGAMAVRIPKHAKKELEAGAARLALQLPSTLIERLAQLQHR
jgi:hypothetical protein